MSRATWGCPQLAAPPPPHLPTVADRAARQAQLRDLLPPLTDQTVFRFRA